MITPKPVQIKNRLTDMTVGWGQIGLFSVVVEGTPPIVYQWHFGDIPIVGANESKLLLENVMESDAGSYKVVVRNQTGLVESNSVLLTVELPPPPSLQEQPLDLVAATGDTTSFSIVASGIGPFDYQWYFGETLISGETKPTLELKEVTIQQMGDYHVVVNNPAGVSVSSRSARLNVTPPVLPRIVAQPKDQSIFVGTNAMFEVSAEGSPPLSFQWTYENQNIPGSVLPSLLRENVELSQAGIYQVIVSSPYGFATSEPVLLSVIDPFAPPINDQFSDRIRFSGLEANLDQSNNNATRELDEPNHAANAGGKSVWWSWTAPRNGTVTLTTLGSDVDTVLGVYTGDSINSLAVIQSNDDAPDGGVTSFVTFPVKTGEEYQVAVDTFGGTSGAIRLNLVLEIERPELKVSRSGRNVILSWTIEAQDFKIQTASNLDATAWNLIDSQPAIVGNLATLKLPIAQITSQFYRLQLLPE